MGRSPSDLVVFIAKRLAQLLPVLLGVIILTFFVTHLRLTGICNEWYPHAGSTTIALCNAKYDQPILNQFWQYFVSLLQGNWGASVSGVQVYPAIAADLPATVELILAALFLMIFIGIPLGVIASEPLEQNATRSADGTSLMNALATSISSSVGEAKWNPFSAWAQSALTISG